MSTDILLFTILVLFLIYILGKKFKYNLPPGPWGLPIIGYLPFLGNDPPKKLEELSKKYGNIFSLYLGRRLVVVVTDAATAKELLNNPSVLDRPEDMFSLLPNGAGFADRNGTEWVEQRRYSMMEMKNLGFGRSEWEKLLEMEVSDFVNYLEKSDGCPVNIYDEISASISNNVLSLVTNKRLPVGDPKRNIIDTGIESFQLINDQSNLISNFPKLYKFFAKVGLVNTQKLKHVLDMSSCIRQEIDDRKEEEGESYVHKYLAEIEKNERLNLNSSFNDSNLHGNVQALIMAGSDTTKVSLLWLFLAMASYPEIQEKVHEEVDSVIGKDGKAHWTDRQKLPYCFATINEGQRWRTIVPLNLQHRTTEDIICKGYDIPKRTHIITVLSAFHNDTRYWKNPDAFQPERFLSEDGKVITEPDGFLPFSCGKRMCPGKTVALIEIFHYFVVIMQKFRILPVSDKIQPDLTGIMGLTYHPKSQPLRFVPR